MPLQMHHIKELYYLQKACSLDIACVRYSIRMY